MHLLDAGLPDAAALCGEREAAAVGDSAVGARLRGPGQSTRSALALLSKPSDQIVSAWQAGSVTGADSPDAAARLRTNMAIAHAIQLKGTPTLIWRKADGTEGRIDGVPTSVAALVSSIGS